MLRILDMMVADPVACPADARVIDVLHSMVARNINSVVVCGEGSRVVGIVTPRDVMARGAESGRAWSTLCVSDVMTAAPVTVDQAESFAVAAEIMVERGIRHLPVTDRRRLVGMLSMRDLMHHRTQHLEGLVAQQTAELRTKNALLEGRNRQMHYHLELAGRIQRQMLPVAPPAFEPFSLAVSYHPFDRVSGDCYDFALLAPDRLGILIADASGHGVSAAFVSVMARSIFHAFGRRDAQPSEVLRTMNEEMPPLIEAEHFITMCFAVVDRRTLRLTYATAGHPPPLWLRRHENEVEPLAGRGHMVGVLPDPDFEDRTVQLRPNDVVLFYTDGAIEARNGTSELFGTERLATALRRGAGTGERDAGDAMLAGIHEDLTRFCGSPALDDDVTCIALTAPMPGQWTPAGRPADASRV